MTKEQFEYKLQSLEIRETELCSELNRVLAIMSSEEPFDKERIKKLYQDTVTNLNRLSDEFRQLCKDFKNLN